MRPTAIKSSGTGLAAMSEAFPLGAGDSELGRSASLVG
jgi:hypothetical protein